MLYRCNVDSLGGRWNDPHFYLGCLRKLRVLSLLLCRQKRVGHCKFMVLVTIKKYENIALDATPEDTSLDWYRILYTSTKDPSRRHH